MLFEIGDPSQLIVRGDIAEIDIGRVEIGQDVDIIVDAYPDTTYRGRVRWIAPVGQQKQGSTIVTFDTEIEITDNAPRLRQGMSCDIDILFARRDSAVYLPVERVLEVFDDEDKEDERGESTRGRFVAYIAQLPDSLAVAPDSTHSDSTRPDSALQLPLSAFSEVELAIGIETSTRFEILSGLASGDHVAEDPSLTFAANWSKRTDEERRTRTVLAYPLVVEWSEKIKSLLVRALELRACCHGSDRRDVLRATPVGALKDAGLGWVSFGRTSCARC